MVQRNRQLPVYKIKKMEFKEEYVNEISRFSNRL